LRNRGEIRHVQTPHLQRLAMTDSYCVALELNKTVSDVCSIPSPMQNPGYNGNAAAGTKERDEELVSQQG
jgi:hypothetical protein